MGASNPKWPRYCFASVAKHLHAAAEVAQLPLVIETLDDRSPDFIKSQHKAEVTIVGPHTRELSAGYHRVTVDVFCVVTSITGGKENAGNHRDLTGALVSALDRCIQVFNYDKGNGSPALVGTLAPRNEGLDSITNTQLRASDSAQQVNSVIEARLVGYFSQN